MLVVELILIKYFILHRVMAHIVKSSNLTLGTDKLIHPSIVLEICRFEGAQYVRSLHAIY